jgi:hypothetical protein
VTLARSATDTFAGIRPADAPAFIVAQLLGAACATALFRWLVPTRLRSLPRRWCPTQTSAARTRPASAERLPRPSRRSREAP